MVKGRGMKKRRGIVKGKGMVRRGMVKGRAYLGPHHCSLMVLDPRCCLCACVPVMSSLGCVASSSSHVSSSCRRWAVSPHRCRHVSGHPRVQCSILDVVTIFDYIYDGDSHGILAEFQRNSNGIPQIPMGIIPGF